MSFVMEPRQADWGNIGHNSQAAGIDLPNNWAARDYQEPLWDYLLNGGKRAIAVWHRRAGKDDCLLHFTAIAASERPGSYWHCLPQYSQARKAIWTAVNPHTGIRRIDEAFPHAMRKRTRDQEMFIEFNNGSTWQLVGSDNYNTLVGASVCGVTFSEFALCNPSAYAYVLPMVTENSGWLAAISTPRGQNHFYSLYKRAKKSMETDGEWFAEVASVKDTGALDEDALESARLDYHSLYGEDIGQQQFEQEYLCDWTASILGAYYAKDMQRVRQEQRIRRTVTIPGRPVHRAWDIGVKDDTTILWYQIQGGKPVILDAYSSSGVGVEHYAEIVANRGWSLVDAIDHVPHDAKVTEWGSGRTRVETMLQHGLNPRLVPNVSKADGMQAVRRTLKMCVFDQRLDDVENPDVAKLVQALEQYRREWDDDKKTFRASEVRDWTTHPADAFRYLALAWRLVDDKEDGKPKKQPRGTVVLEGAPKAPRKRRIKV
jgi:hypothetical protein